MRILLVEFDACLAESMKGLIGKWGHQTEECAGGKDALSKFRTCPYDLVLMEVDLPDMKGHELIRGLRRMSAETWIVTMTDVNSRELELQIREEGVLYYMVKPFEAESLKSLLDHLNRKSRMSERPVPWNGFLEQVQHPCG
jgi:DNA-binding response OmpR family regulator